MKTNNYNHATIHQRRRSRGERVSPAVWALNPREKKWKTLLTSASFRTCHKRWRAIKRRLSANSAFPSQRSQDKRRADQPIGSSINQMCIWDGERARSVSAAIYRVSRARTVSGTSWKFPRTARAAGVLHWFMFIKPQSVLRWRKGEGKSFN